LRWCGKNKRIRDLGRQEGWTEKKKGGCTPQSRTKGTLAEKRKTGKPGSPGIKNEQCPFPKLPQSLGINPTGKKKVRGAEEVSGWEAWEGRVFQPGGDEYVKNRKKPRKSPTNPGYQACRRGKSQGRLCRVFEVPE